MAKSISAGILLVRVRGETVEYLLAHPGGPYFQNKDEGAWQIPKGGVEEGEDFLAAARREFLEETGITPPEPLIPLGDIRQKGGKVVHAWLSVWTIGELPPFQSNTFKMEWPPRSGKMREFAEVDDARFFSEAEAMKKILPSQAPLLERARIALRNQP